MIVLSILLSLACIYSLISAVFVASAVRHGVLRTAHTEYFSEHGTSARHPMRERIEQEATEIFHTPHEDRYLVSFDGLKLHASLYRADDAKGVVICVHGFHSRAEKDFSSLYSYYQKQRHFHVLLIDQRSHMMSEGRYACYGAAEKYDLRDWICDQANLFGQDFPIWLHGESMGASTCMMVSDLAFTGNVRGIISDSGFDTAINQIKYIFQKHFHIPFYPAVFFIRAFFAMFARVSLSEGDAIKALHHTTIPCLFIHGTSDDVVPCEMVLRVYEACSSQKTLWVVPGGGHCAAYWQKEQDYCEKLDQFIQETANND